MRSTISLSAFTLALLVPMITAQGFQNSCGSIGFSTPQLSAECSQQNGQQHFTELDLDFCVGNQSGNLVRQVKYVVFLALSLFTTDKYLTRMYSYCSGAFSSSCSGCFLSNLVLECVCGTGSGNNNAAIDLSECYIAIYFTRAAVI